MRFVSLWMAFFGVAIAPVVGVLYGLGLPDVVPYPHLAMCLPALFFGLRDLTFVGSRVLNAPLAICLLLALLSLSWVETTEVGRGTLIFAALATGVPIAATVVRLRAYRFCAQGFILGSLLLFGVCLAHYVPGARLAHFSIPGQGQVSDPNEFSTQMVAAILLTICLFLIDRDSQEYGKPLFPMGTTLTAGIIGLFTLAVLLSASRGSIACLAAVSGLLLWRGGSVGGRLQATFALFVIALAAVPFCERVVEPALSRLADRDNAGSLGSRVDIWLGAWDAHREGDWYGVGIGGVEKRLAEYLTHGTGRVGLDGIERKASHNSLVEWGVALGVPGVAAAAWLLLSLGHRSARLDARSNSVLRTAMLLFFVLSSVTLATFRLQFWPPLEAITLALIARPAGQPRRLRRFATKTLPTRHRGCLIPPSPAPTHSHVA